MPLMSFVSTTRTRAPRCAHETTLWSAMQRRPRAAVGIDTEEAEPDPRDLV
jgi:hypothetical protein